MPPLANQVNIQENKVNQGTVAEFLTEETITFTKKDCVKLQAR